MRKQHRALGFSRTAGLVVTLSLPRASLVPVPVPASPGHSVRPETTFPWLMFGLVAACTFTLIGWRKWGDLPPTVLTVVVIGANVTTTLGSVLMLHVGFHGRLIALYQGNLQRVQFLSKLLRCVGGEDCFLCCFWDFRVVDELLGLCVRAGGYKIEIQGQVG